jgi:ATP-dependent DNA helicase RecG
MDRDEIIRLAFALESDRTERKSSISDKEEIKKAICAFSNDLPNHNKPGYIFVGLSDKLQFSGLEITDELLLNLSNIRAEGNILPIPSMNVFKIDIDGNEIAIVEVFPSSSPPVRFKGVCWIRTGPSKAIANPDDERRLSEKNISGNMPFDHRSVRGSFIEDLDLKYFNDEYLPIAIHPDILMENQRTTEDKLKSLRFISTENIPTVIGILATGKDPQYWIPGAYAQFLRIEGTELTDPILDQKVISGILSTQLRELDEIISINISVKTSIPDSGPEIKHPDYPAAAIQQLIRNAIMHRAYESTNAPVKFYWFSDRIEIYNPGGLYGQVNLTNFGEITDYRNPLIADVMKVLGYVQRFGVGIQLAKKTLLNNGNPEPDFDIRKGNFLVTIRRRK